MKGDAKSARREQIIEAAYAVLAEKGYGGTSMLAVAKRANASNETLYNWFGSKQGLFTAMVEQNAAAAAAILKDHLAGGSDFSAAFARLGPTLLRLVTSERAVALNRAAAADASETGVLGATIASSGRDHIVPLIEELFERAEDVRLPAGFTPQEAADLYVSVLIGDVQIRRVIGVKPELDEAEVAARAKRAVAIVFGR